MPCQVCNPNTYQTCSDKSYILCLQEECAGWSNGPDAHWLAHLRITLAMRLHEQIETQLRQSIADGRLAAGEQLPTENELSRRFKVSRSTIRQALKGLEKSGLILRIRGRGTFITGNHAADTSHGVLLKSIADLSSAPVSAPPISVVLRFSAESDALQTGILLGVEHAAKSRGYNILFARTDESDEASEYNAIQQLFRIGVCGMVVMPISNYTTTAGVKMLLERNVPLVLVDRYLTDLDTSYVTSDNFTGAYRATEHLIILGYRPCEIATPAFARLCRITD